jgi:hypothetical protein
MGPWRLFASRAEVINCRSRHLSTADEMSRCRSAPWPGVGGQRAAQYWGYRSDRYWVQSRRNQTR